MESHRPANHDDALIEAAIERALHQKPQPIAHIQTKGGRSVYEAALSDERSVILKLEAPGPAEEWRLALEAWAMEQAQKLDVDVPAVLAQDLSMTVLPFRYVVMEKAPGIELYGAGLGIEEERAALRASGRLLARLHRLRVTGYGTLNEERYLESGEVMGRFARWEVPSSLRAEAALNELYGAGALDVEEASGAMAMIESQAATSPPEARLLHGDFTACHVFIDPAGGSITALIDFGDRMGGPPVWDLAGAWLSHIRLAKLPPNATGHVVQGWEAESGARIPREDFTAACLMRLLSVARSYHDAGRVGSFEELHFHLRTLLEDAGRL